MNAQSTASTKGKKRPTQYHRRKPVTLTRAGAVIQPAGNPQGNAAVKAVKWTAFVHAVGDQTDRPAEYAELTGTVRVLEDASDAEIVTQVKTAYLLQLGDKVAESTMAALGASLDDHTLEIEANFEDAEVGEPQETVLHH